MNVPVNEYMKNPDANRKYYSELNTGYMSLNDALSCDKRIPRLKWAKDWIHKISARTMLDIGGIDGFFSTLMQSEGLDCVNIEPMKSAVEWGRNIAKEASLDVIHINGFYEDKEVNESLKEIMDDILNIGKFDVMACLETLEHVLDTDHFLKWACEKADYLLFTTPDYNGIYGISDAQYNPGHIRLYTEQELHDELSKYGDVLELKKESDNLLAIIQVK